MRKSFLLTDTLFNIDKRTPGYKGTGAELWNQMLKEKRKKWRKFSTLKDKIWVKGIVWALSVLHFWSKTNTGGKKVEKIICKCFCRVTIEIMQQKQWEENKEGYKKHILIV